MKAEADKPEEACLNMHGTMTLGAYRLLEKTHNVEWHKGYVFFKSNSGSRPNLEFMYSSMPMEVVNEHNGEAKDTKC